MLGVGTRSAEAKITVTNPIEIAKSGARIGSCKAKAIRKAASGNGVWGENLNDLRVQTRQVGPKPFERIHPIERKSATVAKNPACF